jgi:hypothetical protein
MLILRPSVRPLRRGPKAQNYPSFSRKDKTMDRHSLGEYRVGISFNPGGNEKVNEIKAAAAALIDLVDGLYARDQEVRRLKHLAMAYIEDAAMWAVKAATKPDRLDE